MAKDEWDDIDEFATRVGLTWSSSRVKRKQKHRKLSKKTDGFDDSSSLYERSDLYINDYVNYMGIPLLKAKPEELCLESYKLKPSERIVYFQADDVDPEISNEEIAVAWLRSFAQNSATKNEMFPSEISIDNSHLKKYDCTNYHPEGDECIINESVEHNAWIGGDGRFLGSVYIAPQLSRNIDAADGAAKLYPADQNDWTRVHSFKTWTRIKPTHGEKRATE